MKRIFALYFLFMLSTTIFAQVRGGEITRKPNSERNKTQKRQTTVYNNTSTSIVEKLGSENRRNLYKNLLNDGFDLGSFKDFDRNMADKTVRRNIYNAAKEAGWEMPDYDQYEADMKIYRIGTKGNMKEVSRSEYNDYIKRHPKKKLE